MHITLRLPDGLSFLADLPLQFCSFVYVGDTKTSDDVDLSAETLAT